MPPVAGDVGYGLSTAVGYGTADFLAKGATDRIGFLSTLFYLEVLATPTLVALALWREPGAALPLGPLELLLGLTLVNFVGNLFLYRAFQFGVLSVVSPLVSGYPVVIVVLSLVVLREPLTAADAVGIALTLAGSGLLARATEERPAERARRRIGIVSAAVAFAAYGVFYFALKFVVGPIPPITATAISRGTSVGPSALVLVLSGPVPRPTARVLGRMALASALDNLAFVSYALGVATVGSLAVLGTVSGLFAAVTVAWAMAFLGERLRPTQWAGVASIFLGVALLAFLGGA